MELAASNSTAPDRRPPRCSHSAGLLALALALSTAGCVVVPTPEFHSGSARKNADRVSLTLFTPGHTTMAEVMLQLGEPDAVSPDERLLAYRSEKVVGFLLAGGGEGGGSAGIASLTKSRYLLIAFDENGRLRNHENSTRWLSSTSPGRLFQLGADTNGSPARISILGELIRINGPGEWFQGANGFASLRTFKGEMEKPGGLRGHMMLTDSALYFIHQGEFLNTPPVLSLRYDSLAECRLDKYGLGRRLVVRTSAGAVHSFVFWGERGIMQNRAMTESASELVQSRIPR